MTKFFCTSLIRSTAALMIEEKGNTLESSRLNTADRVLITREKNSIEPRKWIRDLETRMQILKSCHHALEGGHFGRDKTRSKISAWY